jgi:chaperonin GroES
MQRRTAKEMKIKPIKDHIVVKRIEDEEKKVGSIIIPDSAKEKPMTAEVIAVGSGKVLKDGKKLPLEVKVGDRVLVGKYSGSEIKLDNVDYLILREDEVLGIIE